jgi:phosphatidylglycerol:prolipoprotein diacylglycerol transferase
MYPTLPFGPLSLPTAPLVALFAITLGLEIAGRYGRRLGLAADDVWTTGLIAILSGLIAARLWNVLEFWSVYTQEPGLLLSIRPSGFVFWPGVLAALLAGYLFLLRKALDPLRVLAAFAVGLVAAGIVLAIGAFLTGALLGTVSDGPWALPYFDERRHPVGLYQAAGLWLLFTLLWLGGDRQRPGRTVLLAALGYGLIRLVTDAFVEGGTDIGGLRVSQMVALLATLLLIGLLARKQNSRDADFG